ncbi:hypothetical protein A0H81_14402 [Grifola frondosa]|uniref:Uncharacterized protein n=1 Tax=Grifola frondosa TaxID=5627 RepID=A0A1C7LNN4_GRIFR|nr:hypothetical protein A0H81_14402 [Grifola frondosa]
MFSTLLAFVVASVMGAATVTGAVVARQATPEVYFCTAINFEGNCLALISSISPYPDVTCDAYVDDSCSGSSIELENPWRRRLACPQFQRRHLVCQLSQPLSGCVGIFCTDHDRCR